MSFTDGAGHAETRTSDAHPSSGTIGVPRGVTVTPLAVDVAEGAAGTYTVVLDTQPTGNVTVTPASGDAGAVTVSAALTFTAANWSTAQTVTVTAVQDADWTDETVTVTNAVSGADYASVTAADVTVNVDDDETAPPVLVSNAGQAGDDTPSTNRKAQGFTTGSHSGGYRLTGIVLQNNNCQGVTGTATLHQGTRTGTKVADFNVSDDLGDASDRLLTPASPVTLSAGTTYVVVTGNDFVFPGEGTCVWHSTASDSEDAGGATGWTIDDGSELYQSGSNAWVTSASSFKLTVRGLSIYHS